MNIQRVVDELGHVKAQIANLTKIEAKLKGILIDSGEHEINGEEYRATVSQFTQSRLDMDAVRAKLSPQFIVSHTNEIEVTKVSVVARVRAREAA